MEAVSDPMYNIRFTATEMVAIKRALEPLYKAKMGRPTKDKELTSLKLNSEKTVPEEKKETGKSLSVSDKVEKTPQEEKKVDNVLSTFGKTTDNIAKNFGISGFQLEKAEAIVEASEKVWYIYPLNH